MCIDRVVDNDEHAVLLGYVFRVGGLVGRSGSTGFEQNMRMVRDRCKGRDKQGEGTDPGLWEGSKHAYAGSECRMERVNVHVRIGQGRGGFQNCLQQHHHPSFLPPVRAHPTSSDMVSLALRPLVHVPD